jgi:uracil-DNA glycosylase
MSSALRVIAEEVSECRKCPRLVHYREEVVREKRRAFREWTYWGRGVPGFGDHTAKFFILGLAPAAHGANRTGRVFTGDRSGEFLFRALYEAGFANQPISRSVNDGLRLKNAYIAAAVRCGYLQRELEILRPSAVLALGKIAWDAYLEMLKQQGRVKSRAGYKFAHGAEYELGVGLPRLFGIYHPSQQNTQTGLVTPAMYAKVLGRIQEFLAARAGGVALP